MKTALVKLIAATSLLISAVTVHATEITFDFAGYVYLVDNSIAGTIPLGSAITGSYTFESNTVGQSFAPGGVLDPSITYYPGALTAFNATIGEYSLGLGGQNRIFVINNSADGLDRYLVELLQPSGPNINGLPIHDFFLGFDDRSASILSNGMLPLSAALVQSFPSHAGALDFVDGIAPANRATFSITSITQHVPEPSSIALMALGMIGLTGLLARRSKGDFGRA